MTIPERQDQIVESFNALPEWSDRYRMLIELGQKLPILPEENRTEKNKVKGCQSTVWMHAVLHDGKLHFQADSDAAIVKGLIALLLDVYSGRTPQEILDHSPEFLQRLGLNTNLSQTRVSGLAAMVKQLRLYAFAFKTMQEQGIKVPSQS